LRARRTRSIALREAETGAAGAAGLLSAESRVSAAESIAAEFLMRAFAARGREFVDVAINRKPCANPAQLGRDPGYEISIPGLHSD
jgi:hypothetical protein